MMTAPRINRSMTASQWGQLIFLSLVWGGSFFFNHIAVAEVSPLTLVTVRVGGAALALHAILRFRRIGMPRDGRVWIAFFILGLLNNALPFTMIAWGQKFIVSGLAAILNATTPFFTIFIAHYFTRDEKVAPIRLVGIGIGFAGVVWLIGPEALRSTGSDALAQGAVLLASFLYSCSAVFGRRFAGMGLQPLQVAAGQLTASTILMLPVAVASNGISVPHVSFAAIAAMLGLALLSTAFAFLIYFRLLAAAGATNLQLVTLLIPFSAILLTAVFLGERLERDHLIAAGFIASGLLLMDGRLFALCRRWCNKTS